MSSTIGVQFQVAGESLLPALWSDRQPFINLHLISSDTPPSATDQYPYPWTEVSNPSYHAQSIPADSVTVTSDSLGSYGAIGPTQWPFAAYSGPSVTVNGWWIDDRRTNPPTPLWGGPVVPPYPIPLAGGMLTLDGVTVTLRDCATVPPPPYPGVYWLDAFWTIAPVLVNAWTPIVGTFYTNTGNEAGVTEGQLENGFTPGNADTLFDPGVSDYRCGVRMTAGIGTGGDYVRCRFRFRYQDAAHNLTVQHAPDVSQVALLLDDSAGEHILAIWNPPTGQLPRAATYWIECNGPNIAVKVDGVPRFSVINATYQTETKMEMVFEQVGGTAAGSYAALEVHAY